jgi:exopolyphosphatase / guanosine-5'-triphosphate,3'-diphosphate pyrophosphatase
MSDRSAVISIGTNSTRLLIVDFAAKRFGVFGDPVTRILKARSVGTRIGEGLKESGHLSEEAMQRTLEVVQDYYDALSAEESELHVIATSALRRAENAADFVDRIGQITDADVAILDGDEEAKASFRGAITSFDDSEMLHAGVIDVGGGSTEYAVGEHEHAVKSVSCEVGAVRLTEWFPALAGRDGFVDNAAIDGAREKTIALLDPILSFPKAEALAIVGGSATTALAVNRGHPVRFGDTELTREKLQTVFNMLCELPLAKRRTAPGMNPQRADILPAGILILDTAMELLGHDRATVSYNDLLLGYLLLQREKTEELHVV